MRKKRFVVRIALVLMLTLLLNSYSPSFGSNTVEGGSVLTEKPSVSEAVYGNDEPAISEATSVSETSEGEGDKQNDVVPEATINNEGEVSIANSEFNSEGQVSNVSVSDAVYQDSQQEIYAYYSTVDSSSYQNLTQYNEYIQNLLIALFDVTTTGNIIGDSPPDVLNFSREHGIHTYASLQNKVGDEFNPQIVETIISSEALTQVLVENVYSLVSENGYSGVNIDFERVGPAYREAYTQFVQKLVDRLRPGGYKVILSISPVTSQAEEASTVYDFAGLGEIVDKVQVMAYDLNGPWGPPGPISSYQWVDEATQYTVEAIDERKILLGLGAYAYDWNLSNPSENTSQALKDIAWLSSVTGGVHQWDPASQSPYFTYAGVNNSQHLVWYENSMSTQLKTQLALKYHISGVAVWRVGLEDLNFWEAVKTGLDVNSHIETKQDTTLIFDNNRILDNNEPNNTFSDSVDVIAVGSYQSYLSVSGDADIYSFTPDVEGSITVKLSSPQGRDYDIEIYDAASWTSWLAGSYSGRGQEDDVTFAVKPNTKYFILVYGKDATEYGLDPYALSLDKMIRDNDEPNNTFQQAIAVVPGSAVQSYLSESGDQDIYSITPAVAGKITISLASPQDKDYDFEIYGTSSWSSWLTGSYNGVGQTDATTILVKPNTTYYIVINGKNTSEYGAEPYALSFGDIVTDNYEPNHTFQQAAAILPGSTYEAYLFESGERDIYSFTSAVEGKITVKLTSPEGKDYDVEVYGTSDWSNWLAGSDNGVGQGDAATFAVKPNTKYYVVVYGKSDADFGFDSYSLSLENIVKDNYEPNNTFQQAVAVLPGSSVQSYLSESGDQDIYSFTPAVEGKITIGLASPQGKDYDFEIYGTSSWSSFLAGSYNGVGQGDAATFLVKPNKSYYIVINGKDTAEYGADPYSLSLENIIKDNYEPNNTFEQAAAVLPGSTYQAFLFESGERDIYSFTAAVEGNITVKLTSPQGKDYDVEVYGTSGWSSWLAGSYNGVGQGDAATLIVKPNAKYYVVVYGKSEADFGFESYSLSLENIVKDNYEPNNTFQQAAAALPGNSYLSYISVSGDQDIYSFTPNVEGKIAIKLASPQGKDYDFEIYSTSSWSSFLAGSYNGVGQGDAATFLVKPNKTYYIVIIGKGTAEYGSDPYSLSLEAIVKDSYEPNNTFQQAAAVIPGSTYQAFSFESGDQDIYSVTPDVEGKITIKLTSPQGKDYDFEVYGSVGWSNWLAGSYNGAGQGDAATFPVKPNTKYYVVVYGKSAADFGFDSYSLSFEPIVKDTFEPNNTFEQAATVLPGSIYQSYVSESGDTDIYSFTSAIDSNITVNLKSPQGRNYGLEVYDSADWSSFLAGSYNGVGVQDTATFAVKANKKYFIVVYGQAATEFGQEVYELSLSNPLTYIYDPVTNRLSKIKYASGREVQYSYDANGNLLSKQVIG